jgi:hypothetical protein
MNFREWIDGEKTYFHVTLADRIPNIIQQGLIPSDDPHWGGMLGDTSIDKIYACRSPSQAIYYGLLKFRDILRNQNWAPAPILLKTKQQINKATSDPEDKKSVWFEKPIPPNQIELWWPNKGWMPVTNATWIDENINYHLGEEGYEDWEGEIVGEEDDAIEDARKMLMPITASQ